jgi:hypothetical protein
MDQNSNNKGEVEIKFIPSERTSDQELSWLPEERVDVEKRICNLRVDQIAALLNLTGLNFGP